MGRIFVTGSSDGLGRMAAALLADEGHAVMLHARNAQRGREALAALPRAAGVLTGDLSSLAETRALAAAANAAGPFDAVIHNAAMGFREKRRQESADGLSCVFAVNSLAPYVLTALMHRPGRLVYVSSELHRRGTTALDDLNWERRAWRGNQAYSDTKLHNVLLAFAMARRWPGVRCNALEPGWVPTKLGGAHATGDLDQGFRTQAWLAGGDDADMTGEYFYHKRPKKPAGPTRDEMLQERLMAEFARLSGVVVPVAEPATGAADRTGRGDRGLSGTQQCYDSSGNSVGNVR